MKMTAKRLPTLVALAAALLLAVTARGQEVAHYVSVNDLQLSHDGIIIPVHEYVDVVLGPDGKGTIEVGFQHYGASAVDMLRLLGGEAILHEPPIEPADLGEFDMDSLQRVVMTGTVQVGPGRLTWEPDMLAPAAAEGLRAGGNDPHVSPFRLAPPAGGAELSGGGESDLGDSFTLMVDGVVHSYRRADPRLWQLTTFLAYTTEQSIIRSTPCYTPVAQAYLDGRPYPFGAQAVAQLEEAAADRPGLAILQERGHGAALNHFLDAALEARGALNAWVGEEVDREGLGFVMTALNSFLVEPTTAQQAWATRAEMMVRLIEQMHILPGDPDFPDDLQAAFGDLARAQADRYAADPWATTGPWTNAYTGGWATLVLMLLTFECPT
ncbi:MAG: hypothetical protein RLO50_08435 [Azospirillaceae bacterium]